MKKPLQVLTILLVLGVGAVLGSTILQVFAWDPAPASPPTCDPATNDGCNAPINVGDKPQFKKGGFGVGMSVQRNASTLFDVAGLASFNELITGKLSVVTGVPKKGQVLQVLSDSDLIRDKTTKEVIGATVGWGDVTTTDNVTTVNPLTTVGSCTPGEFLVGFTTVAVGTTPAGTKICGTPTGGTVIIDPPGNGGDSSPSYISCSNIYGEISGITSDGSCSEYCPSGTQIKNISCTLGSGESAQSKMIYKGQQFGYTVAPEDGISCYTTSMKGVRGTGTCQ